MTITEVNLQDGLREFELNCRYGELEEIQGIERSELAAFLQEAASTSNNNTWLFYLTGNGHAACLEFMLSFLGNESDKIRILNCKNESGNTPLHWSAINGHREVCELLLANGAKPTIRNNQGLSPATLAEQREFMDCANAILKAYDPDEDAENEGAQVDDSADADSADITVSSNDPEFQEYIADSSR